MQWITVIQSYHITLPVTKNSGAEGCHSCLDREFRSTGAWWVKDLSVILRREQTEGRWRVMMAEERVVRKDCEHREGCGDKKDVLIETLCMLKKQLYIGCAAQF